MTVRTIPRTQRASRQRQPPQSRRNPTGRGMCCVPLAKCQTDGQAPPLRLRLDRGDYVVVTVTMNRAVFDVFEEDAQGAGVSVFAMNAPTRWYGSAS
jgi:hypothetical protein